MCRLALFNKKGEALITKKFGLEKFLYKLELECGGHGNGLLLMKNGKVVHFKKGMDYSSHTIARKLMLTEYDYAIFHTRIASMGHITDANCHPFKYKNMYLAMNGTESGYKGLSEALNITDTEAVLLSINKFNLDYKKVLPELSSNFMGVIDGKVFATSPNSYKSYSIIDEDGAIIIASSLPSCFDEKEPVKKPFVWVEGDKLEVSKKTVITSTQATRYGWNGVHWNEKKKTEETKLLPTRRPRYFECQDCGEIIRYTDLVEFKYCPMCGYEMEESDQFDYNNYFDSVEVD